MKKSASSTKSRSSRKWSAAVNQHSNALDLENRIFSSGSAKQIAASLKRSALKSKRRKGTPFQSAMSMLNFFINRAGKKLTLKRKQMLEKTKMELRRQFGREPVSKKRYPEKMAWPGFRILIDCISCSRGDFRI